MSKQSWQNLIRVRDIEKNDATPVQFGQQLLAVYDTIDGYFVSNGRCTHAGANLCDGYFDGKNIECPLHQGLFDARTGVAKAAPATRNLQMIECRVQHDTLQIYI